MIKRLKNYPVALFTNAYVYCPEAAEAIENSGMIFCDTDAGTPKSFRTVKGVDGFKRVSENLKEYAKHGPVCMKYILLDGYNDSPEDLEGFFELADEVAMRVALTRDYLKPNEVFSDQALHFAAKFIQHFQQNGKINIDLNVFAHVGEREKLDQILKEG